MDAISVLAASGLRARMESLDLLANNLANAGTSGYKGDKEFYTLFTSNAAEPGSTGGPSTMPWIKSQWTDFAQGQLEITNNPLDVALSSEGFFAVQGPSGPLYTRNGSFQVSSSGTLVTADGYPVIAQGGGTLTLDPGAPVTITTDGMVQQSGASVGQLEIDTFPNPLALAKQGNNYFRNVDPKVPPTPAADVQLQQGKIEASNVKAPESAVHLVGVMRQFEMLQKAVTLSGDMNKKAVEEVARIPS